MVEFKLTTEHMKLMKETAVVLHHYHEEDEISPDIDKDPRAKYWRQERNGMWVKWLL